LATFFNAEFARSGQPSPAAKLSSTTETMILVPLTHGAPWQIPGLETIRSFQFIAYPPCGRSFYINPALAPGLLPFSPGFGCNKAGPTLSY
jgi:hypothetical protein